MENIETLPFLTARRQNQWYHYTFIVPVIILAPFLFVFRFVMLLVILITSTLFLLPSIIATSLGQGRSLRSYTKFIINGTCFAFQFTFGNFSYIKNKPKQLANIIVANHVSVWDPIALIPWLGASFVAKKEVESAPYFGMCARLIETVFVDRTKTGNDFVDQVVNRYGVGLTAQNFEKSEYESVNTTRNQQTSEQQNEFCERCEIVPQNPMVIFPEGTTNNQEALMKFKTGAFRFNLDIQCICFKYKSFFDLSSSTNPIIYLLKAFTNPFSICEIQCLQLLKYSDYKNRRQYADAARDVIHQGLNIPESEYGVDDFLFFTKGKDSNCRFKEQNAWMKTLPEWKKMCKKYRIDPYKYWQMNKYKEEIIKEQGEN
ncbi:Lysophosphatidylcholine_acyltransferase/Lyso-PAF acetyltransferase [Hexamita inflata]|uniref:Lysophosphatidylcholine acyltransferase/Lyso-PAF acetyltransferase n=1 Tax=Hexamita inflata TaxID=28002 RepID=A0AA86NTW6_9EUKA|nr:Lysophosphatidylcholine acyltransferase/Lyso-PAF acetyltransferase [Hexamita inflata]